MLREEPFVVLTPATMSGRNAHAVLKKQPFIRLHRRVYAGQLIDTYLHKAGIRPKELFELDGAIAVMVDRGLGVTLLRIGRRRGRRAYRCENGLCQTARSGGAPVFCG